MKPVRAALRLSLLLAALLTALPALAGAPKLSRVYAGADGLALIVGREGRPDRVIPPEAGQTSVTDPRLSADYRSAGWLIEERNCCTSYPIPLRLALYRAGRKRIISDGWMIYDWALADEGRDVAVSTGLIHGATQRRLGLYDVASGRRLAHWMGDLAAQPPAWARAVRR